MGTYEITLLPTQRKFFEVPNNLNYGDQDVCIYQGGFGSGKTWIGSLLGITLCLKYPGIIGLVGAYTFVLLRDTTIQMYFKHLDNLGIKYTYNKQESILYFPNGSMIYFKHFDDPESFKSLTVGFIEMEECSQIPAQTFRDLHGRLRQPIKPEWGDKFVYRFFGHTNPQGNKGWIYEYFKKNPKPNYRRVLAPTTENTHLPQGYIDGLKDIYDKETYAINVLGQDDNSSSNLVVKGFNSSVQVRDDLKINPKYPIHLTCDFNVDPMCWYLAQDYGDMTYILFEITLESTTTQDSAYRVTELLKNYKAHPLIINGDASGNHLTTRGADYHMLRNVLYKEGFNNITLNLSKKNPSIEWRIQCFNSRMLTPDGKHKILIHPQCLRLIYNFENLELKPGTNKPKLPSERQMQKDSKLKYLGHPFDAVSYLVCYYHPIKSETPWEEYQNLSTSTDIFGGKYDTRLL